MNGPGTVAVVGAGILGRLIALFLREGGWQVSIFDRHSECGRGSCSYVGAGMLAPYCELETAEPIVARLGIQSLELWPEIIGKLDREVFFQRRGTLVVAHAGDHRELDLLRARVHAVNTYAFSEIGGEGLRALEPELDGRFMHALYFPEEGQIDGRELLFALGEALRVRGVSAFFEEEVLDLSAGKILTDRRRLEPEWVIDCRGLGARPEVPLRGVRGEILMIEAPEVRLSRPVRVMHPRYPLYVVPRPRGRFLVGATLIESEDFSSLSVRSALELLSAAFALHPGFGEARILESATQCRPALPDNCPRFFQRPGLLRINGLYRHGYLLSPALAIMTREFLDRGGMTNGEESVLFSEAA